MRYWLCLSLLLASPAFAAPSLPSLSQPALSPDGSEVAFVSGGDIWTASSQGGQAHILISHGAYDSRPLYAPDGKHLAFVSTRSGNGDIYIADLSTGGLKRLTYSDRLDQLDAWSPDGKWIYFSSSINDVAGQNDIFRVSAEGGTPLEVSRERYLNEFEGAPSPDGQTLALVAKGISGLQWWRNGHAHIDESELWLENLADHHYRRLVPATAKHAWPMWKGSELFFMSDQSGSENLWSLTRGQVTHFSGGRVLWPSISSDGKAIVFERDFGIWKLDTASGQTSQIPIALRGVPSTPVVTHVVEHKLTQLDLSPDGKKVCFVSHGQIFAAPAKDGGDAMRVTHTSSVESAPSWSSDSNRVFYLSERNGSSQVFCYDFLADKEAQLTSSSAHLDTPLGSPDGKLVAYVADEKELHVLDPVTHQDRVVAHGQLNDPVIAWSPDSRWLAFASTDAQSFRNLNVVDVNGGEVHPVSFLANGESAYQIIWSRDGRFLLFNTSQRSETMQLARVDLTPDRPQYHEDKFREAFKAKKPESPAPTPATPAPHPPIKPVQIDFDGIRQRLTLIPLGLNCGAIALSPDGKELVVTAKVGGQANLYQWSLDPLAKEPPVARQLTSTAGAKTDPVFSPDSKEVYYLQDGVLQVVGLESRTPKPVVISASLDVDFDTEKHTLFHQVWDTLNRRFYDSKFHGHDWGALRQRWAPYVAGARTAEELNRDLNLLIGELNASHSGLYLPPAPTVSVGNLGLRFSREAYEAGQGLKIREVIALGPAALEGTIRPGEYLLSLNGQPITPHTNLDQLLEDQVGRRVVLRVGTPEASRDAVVRPVSSVAAIGLLYRQWVEERRALVDRLSEGKLGYVHIPDMSEESLNKLYLDLDAINQSKRGVVVDIRNNNGGFVNGFAIDVLARKNYMMMTPRGLKPVPARQNLGQRALGLPTVLITNESSLSDAEDFTEGYRALKLGKVVGEPTAGWIIYTSGTKLVDGSTLRVPFIRIQDLRGQTMELHPRPVDIEVERPLGETLSGQDAQLARAVRELLH